MLRRLTISQAQVEAPGLDQEALFKLGLDHVRRRSRYVWTDHNIHDPGITILELLCYAITDLSYRASQPIEDLLASGSGATKTSFYSAQQILTGRPLTTLDYRKLMLDVPGVRNAYLQPVAVTLYLDPMLGALVKTQPHAPGSRPVAVRGLYRALVDFEDTDAKKDVQAKVMECLQANRALCTDFVSVDEVPPQAFKLCAEIELEPDADAARIQAEVEQSVQAYLAPAVPRYSRDELLERPKQNGSRRRVDEIFEGPILVRGFIDDDELAATELRESLRLSDVISILMDINGVRAVRDVLLVPGDRTDVPNKWIIPVAAGHRPTYDLDRSRLVMYKRGMPIIPKAQDVNASRASLQTAEQAARSAKVSEDVPIPVGRERKIGVYRSIQHHFPATYGLGEDGLPSGASNTRAAQCYQLKAYLLLFEQIMANYCQTLSHIGDLFSWAPAARETYSYQVVSSFPGWERVHGRKDRKSIDADEGDVADLLKSEVATTIVSADVDAERRNRFLDHLLSRFGERFHDYVASVPRSTGAPAVSPVELKKEFLATYHEVSQARGQGYNASLVAADALWNSQNVSGLEKRLARLLGLPEAKRGDLAQSGQEGMFLIENILLRTSDWNDPLLKVCVDPACIGCADDDPYSYRIHVILPANAGRFIDMDFRRFAEEIIREETPAHLVPKICWLDQSSLFVVEQAYHAWLDARATGSEVERTATLTTLIEALYKAKSDYPESKLVPCTPGSEAPVFLLGRARIGTDREDG